MSGDRLVRSAIRLGAVGHVRDDEGLRPRSGRARRLRVEDGVADVCRGEQQVGEHLCPFQVQMGVVLPGVPDAAVG